MWLAPVAAANTDQNKTTDFLRKLELLSPDYFPRRQKRKRKPSNSGKLWLTEVFIVEF